MSFSRLFRSDKSHGHSAAPQEEPSPDIPQHENEDDTAENTTDSPVALLSVALYARGGGSLDSYHWAINAQIGEQGWRFHAKNAPSTSRIRVWKFEHIASSLMATNQLLARIIVGHIKDRAKLFHILNRIPVVQEDPNFNCVVWVQRALSAVQQDGECVTPELDWEKIRDAALTYVRQKKEQGRYNGMGKFNMDLVATFDMLEQKETIP